MEPFENSAVGALGTLARRLKNTAYKYKMSKFLIILRYSNNLQAEIQQNCSNLLGKQAEFVHFIQSANNFYVAVVAQDSSWPDLCWFVAEKLREAAAAGVV